MSSLRFFCSTKSHHDIEIDTQFVWISICRRGQLRFYSISLYKFNARQILSNRHGFWCNLAKDWNNHNVIELREIGVKRKKKCTEIAWNWRNSIEFRQDRYLISFFIHRFPMDIKTVWCRKTSLKLKRRWRKNRNQPKLLWSPQYEIHWFPKHRNWK